MNARIPQTADQRPQPKALARPAMYIEIQVQGIEGTQLYPVDVARELLRELQLAIGAIDSPNQLVQVSEAVDLETDPQSQSETPDDLEPPASDDAQAAEPEASPPDA